MNKHKVSPHLLNMVSVLSNKTQNVFISSNNFDKTKKFLTLNRFNFTPYRFASCFSAIASMPEIEVISNEQSVDFIHENPLVEAEKLEQDFINLKNLTQNKFLGQGQTICFIDTGIFPHLDFILPQNRIVKFIDLINKSPTPYDDNGHGTFVAGLSCGNGIFNNTLKGVAPMANIISIKALNKDGNSSSNTILDAMQWVYENHKAYNIGIVCMSFGAETFNNNNPLSLGAEALWKRGIVVVAAAGNSGPNKNTIKSPGNNPNIITVGALDVSKMMVADFSSRGPTIYGHKPDLLAPAVDITSCANAMPPYTTMSGTSVAAPIVAGICAVIKCRFKDMNNNQIKSFLISNCKKITGDLDTEGAGYLNFDNL